MSIIRLTTQKCLGPLAAPLNGAALFFAAAFLLAKVVEPLSHELAPIAHDNSGYVVHETP